MNTAAESASVTSVNPSTKSVKKKAVVAPKPRGAKTARAQRRPVRASRAGSVAEKLVCRYCGSDDLAPSFRKRRDARCRACFKQRYGSGWQGKKTPTSRKTKAAR